MSKRARKRADRTTTVELYASAPGLMLHSPDAVREFVAGEEYTTALGNTSTLVGRLVRDARIVMLRTGSPGLDYSLSFEREPPSSEVTARAIDTTEFHIDVLGDELIVRDGYQAERWGDDDYEMRTVSIATGLYRVAAVYLPHDQHGHMRIDFFLTPAEKKAKSQSWVDLHYVA